MVNNQEQRNKQNQHASRPISRSGRKVSLRREVSLTQASSLRLGESSKKEQWCCRVLSLKRDLLTWARWLLAQDWSSSPEWQLAQHLGGFSYTLAQARPTRLGEIIISPPLFTQASIEIHPE